ncbi:MAG: thioredoxin family protein [Chromatiales bacterium]|nr:thioredoxin family protein [Chromatiales bacterium]
MNDKSSLKVRISGVLAGILLLATLAAPAVAADDPPQPAALAGSAAVYSGGMSWDQFLSGTRAQRETWLKNAGREVPPGLVERFKRAGDGLRLLVVTADWCGDSVHSVPYIAQLASRAGIELRVVDFRTGKAVMEAHRTPDGRASTPTVILLRGDREVAAWVERPASLQWWFLGMTGQISDDERLERKLSWYDWNRGSDALAEIVVLAEQTAKAATTR